MKRCIKKCRVKNDCFKCIRRKKQAKTLPEHPNEESTIRTPQKPESDQKAVEDAEPIVKAKPDEIRLQNVVPCSKYRLEAMKYLATAKEGEERQKAMEYLAGDVITSSEEKPEVRFFPGVVNQKRTLIPEDKLEDMKDIINSIAEDVETEESEFLKNEKETHTLESVDLILGNFDYTNLLLDDILKDKKSIYVKKPPVDVSMQVPETLADNIKQKEIPPVQTSKKKADNLSGAGERLVPKNKVKNVSARTVATQTVHPEIMELILKLLSFPPHLKQTYKKISYRKTCKNNICKEKCVVKESIATQTDQQKFKLENRFTFSHEYELPKNKMEQDLVQSLKKMSKESCNLKRSQSDIMLKNQSTTKTDYKIKEEVKGKAKVDVSTQVYERKRLVIRKSEKVKNDKLTPTKISVCSNKKRNVLKHVHFSFDPEQVKKNSIQLHKILRITRSKSETDIRKSRGLYTAYNLMSDDEKLSYIQNKR